MTKHEILIQDSKNLTGLKDKSIQLIVTSPPYPMIQMWDEMFINQDNSININNETDAFNKMHQLLNATWSECDRVLIDGGFICINIGDAVRTINDNFQLFSNHTKVINYFISKGYTVLPDIHWKKVINAPNKFMGSGMYPAGAYVTYEHEYILIFRKGGKREFSDQEKLKRRKSAYFWEERNLWFSDLWDIRGTSQKMKKGSGRQRNASYPFELPYRLINMYSIEGDTVLDPFAGLGTTNIAAIASNRNSIGVQINNDVANTALKNIEDSVEIVTKAIESRIEKHNEFIKTLPSDKLAKCYTNKFYNCLVKTRQQVDIKIEEIKELKKNNNVIECYYK